jgi:hypothetical protein
LIALRAYITVYIMLSCYAWTFLFSNIFINDIRFLLVGINDTLILSYVDFNWIRRRYAMLLNEITFTTLTFERNWKYLLKMKSQQNNIFQGINRAKEESVCAKYF